MLGYEAQAIPAQRLRNQVGLADRPAAYKGRRLCFGRCRHARHYWDNLNGWLMSEQMQIPAVAKNLRTSWDKF